MASAPDNGGAHAAGKRKEPGTASSDTGFPVLHAVPCTPEVASKSFGASILDEMSVDAAAPLPGPSREEVEATLKAAAEPTKFMGGLDSIEAALLGAPSRTATPLSLRELRELSDLEAAAGPPTPTPPPPSGRRDLTLLKVPTGAGKAEDGDNRSPRRPRKRKAASGTGGGSPGAAPPPGKAGRTDLERAVAALDKTDFEGALAIIKSRCPTKGTLAKLTEPDAYGRLPSPCDCPRCHAPLTMANADFSLTTGGGGKHGGEDGKTQDGKTIKMLAWHHDASVGHIPLIIDKDTAPALDRTDTFTPTRINVVCRLCKEVRGSALHSFSLCAMCNKPVSPKDGRHRFGCKGLPHYPEGSNSIREALFRQVTKVVGEAALKLKLPISTPPRGGGGGGGGGSPRRSPRAGRTGGRGASRGLGHAKSTRVAARAKAEAEAEAGSEAHTDTGVHTGAVLAVQAAAPVAVENILLPIELGIGTAPGGASPGGMAAHAAASAAPIIAAAPPLGDHRCVIKQGSGSAWPAQGLFFMPVDMDEVAKDAGL